jgi:hypothetical protein
MSTAATKPIPSKCVSVRETAELLGVVPLTIRRPNLPDAANANQVQS